MVILVVDLTLFTNHMNMSNITNINTCQSDFLSIFLFLQSV